MSVELQENLGQSRWASCLYRGRVRHKRFSPLQHGFCYRTLMLYLDLDELPTLFSQRWFWGYEQRKWASFRRRDHFGDPQTPLRQAVGDLVELRTGQRPQGPIRLLTQLRYLGYCFNPLSVYYCFAPGGQCLDWLVAEVSNTPWGERHCYVLPAHSNAAPAKPPPDAAAPQGHNPGSPQSGTVVRQRFSKQFHVSPFMPMEMTYRWLSNMPASRLAISMRNERCGETVFAASLTLRRQEITAQALAGALLRHPSATAAVTAKIYWQALRLWLKRAPFFPHPTSLSPSTPASTAG